MDSALQQLSRKFDGLLASEGGVPACEQIARLFLLIGETPIRRFIIPMPDRQKPYLERLILSEKNANGGKTYLHIIYEPDGDRDPHDHPWDFRSKIIWGSYTEMVYELTCEQCNVGYASNLMTCKTCGHQLVHLQRAVAYKSGDTNVKHAADLHRITSLQGPVITLVERGPKVREWGFQTVDGWEHNAPYIKRKFPNAVPVEVD